MAISFRLSLRGFPKGSRGNLLFCFITSLLAMTISQAVLARLIEEEEQSKNYKFPPTSTEILLEEKGHFKNKQF
jgi:hypothetical protein